MDKDGRLVCNMCFIIVGIAQNYYKVLIPKDDGDIIIFHTTHTVDIAYILFTTFCRATAI